MDNRGSCHNWCCHNWCSHRSSHRSSNIVNLLGRLRCNRGNRLLSKDHRCGHCNRSCSRSVVQREILRLDSSSSISLRVGDGMCLLGGGHFRCVHNRGRQGHGALGKICAGNSETCSIGNVLDSLHHTRGVHVTISASNNSISSLDLLPYGVRVVVAKAVLTKIVLSMVLRASCVHSGRLNNRCSNNGGRGGLHVGGGLLHNGSCWCGSVHVLGGSHVVVVALSVGQVRVVNSRGNGNLRCRCNRSRSSSRCGNSNGNINVVHGQVGGSNTEAHGIRDVVHSLHDPIGVHVAVSPTSNSICCLDFWFCLVL